MQNYKAELASLITKLDADIKETEERLQEMWEVRKSLSALQFPPQTEAPKPAPATFVPTRYNRRGRHAKKGAAFKILAEKLTPGEQYTCEQIERIVYGSREKAVGHSGGNQILALLVKRGVAVREGFALYRYLGTPTKNGV